jgi:hypothetical protein
LIRRQMENITCCQVLAKGLIRFLVYYLGMHWGYEDD